MNRTGCAPLVADVCCGGYSTGSIPQTPIPVIRRRSAFRTV
jgi:hypothetical protein